VGELQAAVAHGYYTPSLFQERKSAIQCGINLTESNSLSATPNNLPLDTGHSAQYPVNTASHTVKH
jgi:hypothetical protein